MYRSDIGVGELVVHTTESTWVRQWTDQFEKPHDVHTKQPYKRIVGLAGPDQELLWTPSEIPADSSSSFDPAETTRETISLPATMLDRVVEFFDENMSEDGFNPDEEKYNCHRFAAAATGINHLENPLWPREFVKEQNERQPSDPLPVGQIGVIGAITGGEGQGMHSVIGLGEDRDECLQVMWTQGHMGIASYNDLLKFYKTYVGGALRLFRGISHVGLYTTESPSLESSAQASSLAA